ncbi:MAG TPA: lysylphosphatidylglycerol synthase transmembrane domain-containing protein [Streptosporangiaceae bacterium]
MSDQPATPPEEFPAARSREPLATRIEDEKSHPLAWKTVVTRAVMVAVAGLAIYLVFPAITEVFASWPRLSTLNPWWFAVAVAAEVAHFTCTIALQRLALRTSAWFPVVTSLLAGNAITLIVPGGAAVGAAVQFRMLAVSGRDTDSTVGGLAAFSLLGVGGLLALPAFSLPIILAGAPTSRGLVNAAILGAVAFVAFVALGAVVLVYDAPLRWVGRWVQELRNWVLRRRPPWAGVGQTLITQRNDIRAVLGRQWWQALLLSAGRLTFDYLCLLAALQATGSRPRPSLILVAYAVAGVIGMIPVTPGGLGIVEASLTGLLVLADVNSSQAVLATLTYRLASYWLPLCAGPIAYGLFRIRYRNRPSPHSGVAQPGS